MKTHRTRRHAIMALALLAGGAVAEGLQKPAPAPPPKPAAPSGAFSPFRQKGFAGTTFGAAALEQPGCPLAIRVTALKRSERGVTLSMQLSNLGDASLGRQVLGAWVLAPDGTIRGSQEWVGERNIGPTRHRGVDLNVRSTVMPDDVIIVAVREAAGRGTATWRRDANDLERSIREAVTK